MNALFYLLKTGCQGRRMLPKGFAPFKTVHYHFLRWIESGRIERLCTRLRRAARARGRAQAQSFGGGDPGARRACRRSAKAASKAASGAAGMAAKTSRQESATS
jgi:transposase